MSKTRRNDIEKPSSKPHRLTVRRIGNRYYTSRIEARCACGLWQESESVFYTRPSEAEAKIYREWNEHKSTDESKGAPMLFIGNVQLTKVEHEIWVASYMGDFPNLYTDVVRRRDYNYAEKRFQPRDVKVGPGWWVLLKNSIGWKAIKGPHTHQWESKIEALKHIKNQRRAGRKTKTARSVNVSSIEIPMAEFHQYLQGLIEKCKEADTVEEAQELQKEVDEVFALQDAVHAARVEMNRRVIEV